MSIHDRRLRIAHCWMCAGILAAATGALLAFGCERRADTPDVSASGVREQARATGAAAADTMKRQVADLEAKLASAERDTAREMDDARQKADELPEEAREQLNSAMARTETARDNARERLNDLKEAGAESWDTTRQRVDDAFQELADARREVVAALQGERTTG
ncbi:MAG TPA: hypothetical protein VKH41_02405 [Myxococcota bacterium]|nr:hypothetical protein [Myxococcota bacterium]